VGAGEVALATAGSPRLQLFSEGAADIDAVIKLLDGAVTIEAKKHQALRVDEGFLPMAEPYAAQRAVIATLAAVNRRLRVRTVQVPNASVMSAGGMVIREQPSSFEHWLSESAARGAAEVSEELTSLRERGMIDGQGRLLVPLPEDMSPDSKTDV
jgi:hypothetical protein